QSASFVFDDAKHGADLFSLKTLGYSYSRLTNPTVAALEEKLATIEGGVGATCAASGLGSQMLVLSALMHPGDHIVSSRKLYGGSFNQFKHVFPSMFDWQSSQFDPTDPASAKAVITDKTKAIFAESLSNPEGVVTDIEGLSKVAREAGIPLIIDNTMATPYLCKPLEYGANIVTYSTTKFISGHGNAIGGAVIDGGNFDWMAQGDKFPRLTQPDAGYNGLIFAKEFGNMALAIHNHAVGLRDLGLNQQPMNAYLTFMGLETLSLRMERHCSNAKAVAEWLQNHEKVESVSYAGLPGSPHHKNAQKYMKGAGGAVFTVTLKHGFDACIKVVENLQLFSHLANIGDTRSLIIHPASTTHAQLNPEDLEKAGVNESTLRMSIGIETLEDIIADLDQALAKIEVNGARAA
ncbi:MAG: O-acetylhomoserine aminocarboxypropyltransferase/cysteine synthase, partial [Alphaproteobacteria bacterium]|nr:O-acetylhomoserine aminocarboxypropyltransferase/cysteine synthase [Alphaproteobacteria bacterium]